MSRSQNRHLPNVCICLDWYGHPQYIFIFDMGIEPMNRTSKNPYKVTITNAGYFVNGVLAERKKLNGYWYLIVNFADEEVWLTELNLIYILAKRIPNQEQITPIIHVHE